MTELVYPQSIDAGTVMAAAEVQANFDAAKAVINGQLQGGSGSDRNLAANGVTARELADLILTNGLPGPDAREGLITQPSATTQALFVTPGAGLVLNYSAGTAWVRDDSGVLAAGALLPVVVTGASVTVGANATGNPRLDQIILTMTGYGTGTVSVLAGTANAATTLNNRTGAAALPNDAIRLADVLVTNGFAGPFVDHTSLRNRTPWAVPMKFAPSASATFDVVVDSFALEQVSFDVAASCSSNGSVQWRAEGSSGAVYQIASFEQQVSTAGASSTHNRVQYGGNSATLSLAPNGVGAVALQHKARRFLDLSNPGSINWWMMTGTSAAAPASGTIALSQISAGDSISHAGPLTYLTLFPGAGTLTGSIVVDRVPMA